MASAGASSSNVIDYAGWNELTVYLESLPDTISNWCFMPLKKEFYGDVTAYAQYIKPHSFVSVHMIRKKLNAKGYASNTEVLAAFHEMAANAFRYWYDPTPVSSVDAARGGSGKKKDAGYEPRKNVVLLVAKSDEFVASHPTLASSLAAEGTVFVPWTRAFKGATFIADQLEEWYKRCYAEAYWFYYRCVQAAWPWSPRALTLPSPLPPAAMAATTARTLRTRGRTPPTTRTS
jgi:hypothetical protein